LQIADTEEINILHSTRVELHLSTKIEK